MMEEHSKNRIFVVVPAYNEEKMIVKTINDLLKFNYKLIVVDDCSLDDTYQEVKDLALEKGLEEEVLLIKHKMNRGQGAALQTGTDLAIKEEADIVVHFDGDGQFVAGEIERSIKPIINSEAEVVLGSRFIEESGNENNDQIPFFKKHVILPVSRVINYFLTGLKLTDAHCGFRALNREAAEKINITQDRMSHNTQIVAQIKKHRIKYREVPVTVIYHEFGQNVGGGFKILKELFIEKLIR